MQHTSKEKAFNYTPSPTVCSRICICTRQCRLPTIISSVVNNIKRDVVPPTSRQHVVLLITRLWPELPADTLCIHRHRCSECALTKPKGPHSQTMLTPQSQPHLPAYSCPRRPLQRTIHSLLDTSTLSNKPTTILSYCTKMLGRLAFLSITTATIYTYRSSQTTPLPEHSYHPQRARYPQT